MSIKRRRSRRTVKLTDRQRFLFSISCEVLDRYGERYAFRDPEHRRQVHEANRDELDAPRPDLPGTRNTCFWEYTFPAIFKAKPHLDRDGLVRLTEGGIHPYQHDEASILKAYGLLTGAEELALRRQFPTGTEWRCPKFLQGSGRAEGSEQAEVIEIPERTDDE